MQIRLAALKIIATSSFRQLGLKMRIHATFWMAVGGFYPLSGELYQ